MSCGAVCGGLAKARSGFAAAHFDTADVSGTSGLPDETAEDFDGCCLACAVFAEESEHFVFADGQVKAV